MFVHLKVDSLTGVALNFAVSDYWLKSRPTHGNDTINRSFGESRSGLRWLREPSFSEAD